MIPLLADRVKETTQTTGTGTVNLDGPVTGFRSFVTAIGTGNACFYVLTNDVDWEVGIGTVTDATPDTLSRDTILASSNGGSAVSFGSGTKEVFVTNPATYATRQKAVIKRASSAQTISTATDTKIAFDTILYDVGGIADVTTNDRIDISRAGRYFCHAQLMLAGLAIDTELQCRIKINGTLTLERSTFAAVAAADYFASVDGSLELAAGDFVEMFVEHNHGSDRSTSITLEQQAQLSVTEI